MSIVIELPQDVEERLRKQAESKKLSVDGYIVDLIEQDRPRNPLDSAIDAMTYRTPAEKEAMRSELLSRSRPASPLPPGKTLEDVVLGSWPGEESDQEIDAALKELS